MLFSLFHPPVFLITDADGATWASLQASTIDCLWINIMPRTVFKEISLPNLALEERKVNPILLAMLTGERWWPLALWDRHTHTELGHFLKHTIPINSVPSFHLWSPLFHVWYNLYYTTGVSHDWICSATSSHECSNTPWSLVDLSALLNTLVRKQQDFTHGTDKEPGVCMTCPQLHSLGHSPNHLILTREISPNCL